MIPFDKKIKNEKRKSTAIDTKTADLLCGKMTVTPRQTAERKSETAIINDEDLKSFSAKIPAVIPPIIPIIPVLKIPNKAV